MARPKKYTISLSSVEVHRLKTVSKKKTSSRNTIKRCGILMELDENNPRHLTHEQIAKTYAVSKATVANIVSDYVKGGVEKTITYQRNPKSNARLKLDGRAEARIIELACGPAPDGHSRWTLRLLAEKSKIILDEPVGKDAIRTALKKTNFDLT